MILGCAGTAEKSPRASLLLWCLAILIALPLIAIPLYLFLHVLRDPNFELTRLFSPARLTLLLRSIGLALAVSFSTSMLALPLAWFLERGRLPLAGLWSILLPLPLAIPSYLGAYAYLSACAYGGPLHNWLGWTPQLSGFTGTWLILTLLCYPYVYLPARAGIAALNPELEDAARTMGYSPLRILFKVILPQLRPALLSGALLVGFYTLSDFGAVALMRCETFTRVIYLQYASMNRFGAAASSLFLTVIALGGAFFLLRSLRHSITQSQGVRIGSRTDCFKVPLWGLLLPATVVLLALVVPLGAVLTWSLQPVRDSFVDWSVWNELGGSLRVAALAALCGVLLAFPIAYLAARSPGKRTHLIESLSHLGFVVPGIALALAVVFLAAGTPLYQTYTLLILIQALHFLPLAIGALKAPLQQIQQDCYDAARTMGARRFQIFCRVTLPLTLPGISYGGLLIFLATIKELPVTLILSPLGFGTLATRLWSCTEEAFFAEAARVAFWLLLLGVLPMMAIVIWREIARRNAR